MLSQSLVIKRVCKLLANSVKNVKVFVCEDGINSYGRRRFEENRTADSLNISSAYDVIGDLKTGLM